MIHIYICVCLSLCIDIINALKIIHENCGFVQPSRDKLQVTSVWNEKVPISKPHSQHTSILQANINSLNTHQYYRQTSTVSTQINTTDKHQQSQHTSILQANINRLNTHQNNRQTSTVSTHIKTTGKHQQSQHTSKLQVNINSLNTHQNNRQTSTVSTHIKTTGKHQQSQHTSILQANINSCCCCCRPHSTNVLPAESSTRIMWQPTVSPPRWQGKAPLCRDSSRDPG